MLKHKPTRALGFALAVLMWSWPGVVLSAHLGCAVAQAPSVTNAPELFRYHREDAAPDGLTSIRLNAGRLAAAPVQPLVFSNFLEHIGGVIQGGLWADALGNPNLEKIEDSDTMPPWWDTVGSTLWAERGYLSPRCVRLMEGKGVLSQRVFLPVQRVRAYTLTLYTRAASGVGNLSITLRSSDDVAGPVAFRQSIMVSGDKWQYQRISIIATASIQKGQPARLVLAHENGAPIDVDQIELFPIDAIDGEFDPDVIRAARAWHIPLMRYAGNFSSGYHWRNGVGLRVARPTLRNHAWGGVESNHFGTDEFLRFCQLIGATPQIAVNAGNGTPEEAAAWVRYVNGQQRRVPVWEIGNELYGGWQIGHTDAPGNAARFARFREAMLKVDPRLQIIATGKGDEFQGDGLERNRAWNEAVLRGAQEKGGWPPDWLSIHPLVGLPSDLGNRSYAEQYESAMAHPAFVDRTLLPSIIETIRAAQGPHGKTRIAVNEWGIIVGGGDWAKGPNHDVLAGAIFNALTLNAFLRHSDWVTLANMTAFMHGGGIKKPNGVVIVDPQYYTQQLYTLAMPRFVVETEWSGPGRDVPRRGFLPAVANVPDVDVVGALSAGRQRLMAFVVNRSLDQARPIRFALEGFKGRAVAATILSASDVQARNTWDKPDMVAPRPFALPNTRAHNWTVALPPHSLVVFTFQAAR